MSKALIDDSEESVVRIRSRMAELRRELTSDVEDVGRSARAMTDVGLYVRRFPWASVAVAIAVGYMLVPRRKEVIYAEAATLADAIKKSQVRVETSATGQGSKDVIKGLAATAVMSAARMGMNYFWQRLAAARDVRPTPESASTIYETD